jgi:hypothetical protein
MEITQHKHTIQSNQNQTRQTIEKSWFNIFDFLRYCDKIDMAKGLVLQDMDLGAWRARSKD